MRNLGIAKLTVEQRAERSVVASQYSQAPLQLHTPLYLNGASHPTMFLRSPSAGFLDGDEHRLHVEVLKGARLVLRTQAASLIYPGISEQHISIDIADGGNLLFHPHPLILARAANFTQRISVHLHGDAELDFRDSWSCGRVAMDERWLFEKFDNQTEIFRDGVLFYRDRAVITPCQYDVTSTTLCGPHNFFSTRFRIGDGYEKSQLANRQLFDVSDAPSRNLETAHWTFSRPGAFIERVASRILYGH